MDLLKRELERKKKAVAAAKSKYQQKGKSRFIRAKDLRKAEEGEDQDEAEETTQQNPETSNHPSDAAVSKRKTPVTEEPSSKKQRISASDVELRSQLRLLGLPVHLFGETLADREERLTRARTEQQNALAGKTEKDEFRLGRGYGIRNPFLEKDDDRTSKTAEPPTKSKEASKETVNDEEEDEKDPHKRIVRFFKGLLRQWEDDLAARPESVQQSVAGRTESKTLKQCKDYIRPLFQLCKSRKLQESLLMSIDKIVTHCQEGEYVKANDVYLDVAIGRAAWPLGVTMVGIHARSGRAKIESSNIAHVMNSELQRKYLTSVKRLITYHQQTRPDVVPSKKVS